MIILKEDLNKPLIHIYKLNITDITKAKKDSITEPNHGVIDLSSLFAVSNDVSIIATDNIAITQKSKLIVIYLNTQLLFVELETKNIILCHKINRINVNSVKYFLSPTNLALNKLNNLKSISANTDNLISQGNLNNLILINYDYELKKLRIYKTDDLEPKRMFVSYVLNQLIVLAYDKLNEELIGFKLNTNDNNPNVFENISFKTSIHKSVIDSFGLSSDNKYVYVIEQKKNLRFFRYEDSKKIAETVVYSRIGNVSCSDEYISLTMQNNRVISFLIVDPLIPDSTEKIKKLESRSKDCPKDAILSDVKHYFEHDQRILRYDQIFHSTIDFGDDEKSIKLKHKFDSIRKSKS